ncbi:hypothetical protein AYO21_05003 [Fonsecaea monophora]|uniref:DUF7924 domain-containing protein n=1 Tax=Fonsecaea monophora TaxID=254056 RepID=A0A177F914_9EURO|nr:hypothetical protein AYO21_05003 [Fonsecaea monophora]OAG40705.1 hypothetical protein AYO21_05003 [Fonsecaea monophora]
MPSAKSKDDQRMKRQGPASDQRPHTRAFAKLHGLSVKNFTVGDLEDVSRKYRSRKISKPPTRSRFRSSSSLPPPSKDKRSAKTTLQPPVTSNTRQTRSSKSKNKDPLQFLGGLDARDLPSQKYQSPAARQLPKVQLRPRELPISLSRPGTGLEQATDTEKRDNVSTWLNLVSPDTAQTSHDFTERHVDSHTASVSDSGDMESSSSHLTSTSVTTENTTTAKASTVRHIDFMEHLEFRGITDKSSGDDKLQELGLDKIVDATPSHVEFEKFESLVRVLEDYLKNFRKSVKDRPSENGLPVYDALRHDISHWRPDAEEYRRFPPMSARDFAWDQLQCSTSSEADFHRTIMISIIDRLDFRGVFTFSCEEQWRIEKKLLIKATKDSSKITQPKPDLAISFHRDVFIESILLEYPIELGSCLHPGKRGRERWFPFLFMEAKREDSSLRAAFEKNLYSTSQALFNIFQWMRQAPQLREKFFNDVRTFSIVLNNEDMVLRMHRAEQTTDDRLSYHFTEVARVRNYSRDVACHMVKSVLLDYALPHLYPILKETFQMVAGLDHLRESGAKRKRDLMDAQPSTLSIDHSPGPGETDPPHLRSVNTGLSFDADNLTLAGPSKRSRRGRRGR